MIAKLRAVPNNPILGYLCQHSLTTTFPDCLSKYTAISVPKVRNSTIEIRGKVIILRELKNRANSEQIFTFGNNVPAKIS